MKLVETWNYGVQDQAKGFKVLLLFFLPIQQSTQVCASL